MWFYSDLANLTKKRLFVNKSVEFIECGELKGRFRLLGGLVSIIDKIWVYDIVNKCVW